MRIIIQRDKPLKNVVFGKLYISWLKSQPDIYTIVPHPAIPAGVYPLLGHNTEKFKDVWQIANVPGHTGILIHVGNYASDVTVDGILHEADSTGCILPGFGINEDIPMVLKSADCIKYLRTTIGTKPHGQYMNIDVEIRDA